MANSGVLDVNLLSNGGLTFSGDAIQALVDNSTIIINGSGQLEATTQGDIQGVTAGAGLVGGGESGFLQLDVELTSNGGLTFSTTGDGGTLEVDETNLDYTTIANNLQGNGLTANSGVLDVNVGGGLVINSDVVEANVGDGLIINDSQQIAVSPTIAGEGLTFSAGVLSLNPTASAVPYYGDRNKTPNATAPNTPDENSGITITNTPNDYSRVNVYVNGQLQYLGDGTASNVDCYFGTTGSAVSISDITAGQTLYWNGDVAGFRLTSTDRIDIVYEV